MTSLPKLGNCIVETVFSTQSFSRNCLDIGNIYAVLQILIAVSYQQLINYSLSPYFLMQACDLTKQACYVRIKISATKIEQKFPSHLKQQYHTDSLSFSFSFSFSIKLNVIA